jgi:hypothetical protein
MFFPASVVDAPVEPATVADNGTSARVDAATTVNPLTVTGPEGATTRVNAADAEEEPAE